MRQSEVKRIKSQHSLFLILIILFIIIDVLCENYIVQAIDRQISTIHLPWILGFVALQIFAAPLQASFSDFYCRKKSINLSLIVSFIALTLVVLTNYFALSTYLIFGIVILLKGSLGNTVPISWAAVADTQTKNLRFSLALSTAGYAIGYLLIALFKEFFNRVESSLISLILYIVLILLSFLLFKDLRDYQTLNRKQKSIRHFSFFQLISRELKSIAHELRDKQLLLGLSSYLLWATSLYTLLLFFIDFRQEYIHFPLYMMAGYLIGVILIRRLHTRTDDAVIRIGYWVSFCSLFVVIFIFPICGERFHAGLIICFSIYSLANAFLSPSILASLSNDRNVHQQGTTFGFIESTDSVGFLLGALINLLWDYLQLGLFSALVLSLIIFTFS